MILHALAAFDSKMQKLTLFFERALPTWVEQFHETRKRLLNSIPVAGRQSAESDMLSIELGEILTAEVPQDLGEIVHDKAVARGEKFILDGNFPAGV